MQARRLLHDTDYVLYIVMIKSFADKDAERLWKRQRVRRFQGFDRQALRRLRVLDAATRLEDLMLNPSNRFHALRGDRKGQFAIAINRQWRVCFAWNGEGAIDVAITDYH